MASDADALSIKLSTGQAMPLIGLGTWQAAPGEVGDAVGAEVRLRRRAAGAACGVLDDLDVAAGVGEGARVALRDVAGAEQQQQGRERRGPDGVLLLQAVVPETGQRGPAFDGGATPRRRPRGQRRSA